MTNVSLKFLIIVLACVIGFISSVQASQLEKLWETKGFSMPESTVTSQTSDWIYVSNVNADKKGFISKLSKNGKIDKLKWITDLNNPAGLALYGDKLYVGDSSQVHIIDVKKQKLIKSITSKEAKALNDVTISNEGQVFISDIATGKIFTIKDGKLVVWFEAPEIKHPNGLFVQDNYLFIADFASKLSHDLKVDDYGSIYKVNLTTKSYSLIPSSYHLGGLDGLIGFNDALLVSSNPTGELYAITKKERVLVGTFEKGLADISMEGDTLYVPFIFSGKIATYTLTKEAK